ncbi:MAG: peptide ABC transporter substrate-binding protein [Chlamydiales bacterium]
MPLSTPKERTLSEAVVKTLKQFPNFFDSRLRKGLHLLIGNSGAEFIEDRSLSHLRRFLLIQFVLQKKIEDRLRNPSYEKRHLFLKLFKVSPQRICLALTLSMNYEEETFGRKHILKVLKKFIPGIQEISRSYFNWHSVPSSYVFCYLEVQKLRGKATTIEELREIQAPLKEALFQSITPSSPPIFWPYNQEEAYRQLLLLRQEIHKPEDLPHVSIHFREQTPNSLEFLVHLVRPDSITSLEVLSRQSPPSLGFVPRLFSRFETPLACEAAIFSLYVPLQYFYETDAINLLQARRYVAKCVEKLVGVFRDYNGGLFEKQQERFEKLNALLSKKIPNFHLFGERLFYSLLPIESQISLKEEPIYLLFKTFSEVMQETNDFYVGRHSAGILVIKAENFSNIFSLIQHAQKQKNAVHAWLKLSQYHYFCYFDPSKKPLIEIEKRLSKTPAQTRTSKVLKLAFQEGPPPSVNPHLFLPDMRCRTLFKSCFEGLTRINEKGEAVLAGAEKVYLSEDGLTYQFIIRPNGWTNGEKVTAYHYERSIKKTLSTKNISLFSARVKAHDAQHLEIELEKSDPLLLKRLSQPLFFPTYDESREPHWLNGPYLIHHQDEKTVILERNPYFWDYKQLYFERIEINLDTDPEQVFSLYKKGQIDWIGDPFSPFAKEYLNQLEIQKKEINQFFWLFFNTQHLPFTTPSIRKAFGMAIERLTIVQQHLVGDTPLYTPLPPSFAFCTEFKHDCAQAKLLFEKGLKEVGFTRKTFPPLTLIYSHQPQRKSLAEYLKTVWEETFEIRIHLKRLEWNTFYNHLQQGQFQIGGCYVSSFHNDPIEFLARLDASSPLNFCQWKHPIYQKKMTEAKKTGAYSLLKEAEEILIDQVPFIPIANRNYKYTHNPRLKGYILNRTGEVDFRWSYFTKD